MTRVRVLCFLDGLKKQLRSVKWAKAVRLWRQQKNWGPKSKTNHKYTRRLGSDWSCPLLQWLVKPSFSSPVKPERLPPLSWSHDESRALKEVWVMRAMLCNLACSYARGCQKKGVSVFRGNSEGRRWTVNLKNSCHMCSCDHKFRF